ncbi:MAG: MFS transporter, partial [Chloroflexota bacterium]
DVLKNRNFMMLWSAGLVSIIGNWVLLAAIPFYIFDLTGSAMATAGVFMAFLAPGIIFGSIAGVFVDRWDKLRTMLVVNLIQMVVVLLLTFVQSAEQSWILFVVLFIESSIAQFFGPAENALLPKLVAEDQLVAANSLNSMNDNLARLIGPAIGGVVLAVYGFSSVVVIDAASFGLAALLIFFVMVSYQRQSASEPVQTEPAKLVMLKARINEIVEEWQAGLGIIRSKPILSNTFIVIGIALFADAIISAILVIFLQEDLGMGSAEFGYIMTARGIGGLIGGIALGQIGERINPRYVLSVSLLALSLAIFAAVNVTTLTALIVIMVVGGIPAVTMFVAVQTIFHKNSPEEYLGRVFGLFQTVLMLLMFLGSAIAGIVGESVPARQLMIGAVVIYLFAAVLGLWLMSERRMIAETAVG